MRRPLPSTVRARMRLVALLLFCLLALGCDRSAPDKQRLDVFAASSLQTAFESWEVEFEREHPAVDVRLTFSGSQILRLQVEQGAQADVFVSADAAHVAALRESGFLADSTTLAENELVVATPQGTTKLAHFSDLTRAERVVLGTEAVPIGHYGRAVLEAAEREMPGFADKVRANVVSYENNVRLVRAKVQMGEADAAFLYRSEALDDAGLRIISIPERFNVTAQYRAGVLTRTNRRELAETFVRSLISPRGRAHLRRFGFRTGEGG